MTAEMLAMPRTPHVKRNGGFNLQKWGWLYMRISGVLLIVLIFGHLFVNLLTGEGIHQITFGFVAGKYAGGFWQVWDGLMLWLALIHGANGMTTVTNDYVTHKTVRTVLVSLIWIAAAVLIILGTYVVIAFDPCIGATAGDVVAGVTCS
ncbi:MULTISPECIES: succinate dehydrogenase hydrophobic membrane anchor subunit [Microbacterium]|jgi:succinate dehydrogenase / fumarate reductase membrane anchor subunit|uniref:succinate dehydrogenase hydrophobic membrane anchor subunit n=1 Tax=Microbacterium TaxID=33882 RepID=UPI001E42CBDF|nr:succinate dehydrogenase hydrophobic membrane anchor subunit [Microbacterium nymphoidis]MCD2499678.1 succinate dehydrogenase hydrophobic membrane anchor subunit [Microbacterium nymphoidis]MDR2295005.1 succinate dehydrogenase hydrophobic membrane anchor subunit [Microbacterium sp.]